MSKFHINYLALRRPKAMQIFNHFIKRIDDKYKNDLTINILCNHDDRFPLYEEYKKELIAAGIKTNTHKFGNRNYLSKIDWSVEQDCEFSIKWDEDVFMSEHVWNYMFETSDILESDENLLLAPIISNGIPSCDLFISDFLDETDRTSIHNSFLSVEFKPLWGVDYKVLSNRTTTVWDYEEFQKKVIEMHHYYKGIHPIRVNFESQKLLNDSILKNWDRFIKKTDYYISYIKNYFCNSGFLIKTDRWRKIINRKDLYKDDFDEVPLNLYREEKDLSFLFIRNGFCLHTIYNTIPDSDLYEQNLIDEIIKRTAVGTL